MRIVLRILLNAAALWLTVRIVPGLEFDGSVWTLLLIAVIFGVVNGIIGPIVKILSLPLIIFTLGIFYLILNALLFWLVIWLSGPSVFDLGLTSDGFWPAFWGAIAIAVITWIINLILPDD